MAIGRAARAALLTGIVIVLLGAALVSHPGQAATGAVPARASLDGKALYRTYCGKCHALAAALSAGFGSSGVGGLGVDGGPSFDELRIPVSYTIQAITEPTGGHERLRTRLSPGQVKSVATWLAQTTSGHPLPALPTDG